MDSLITYDVSSKNSEVKAAMLALKYQDRWTLNGVTTYLPNSTLWKKGVEPQEAKNDLAAVTQRLGVKLEREIAVPLANWVAIPGEPHK